MKDAAAVVSHQAGASCSKQQCALQLHCCKHRHAPSRAFMQAQVAAAVPAKRAHLHHAAVEAGAGSAAAARLPAARHVGHPLVLRPHGHQRVHAGAHMLASLCYRPQELAALGREERAQGRDELGRVGVPAWLVQQMIGAARQNRACNGGQQAAEGAATSAGLQGAIGAQPSSRCQRGARQKRCTRRTCENPTATYPSLSSSIASSSSHTRATCTAQE